MVGRLADKACLITGTGGAIGRATALAFSLSGARVIGCDIASEAAEKTLSIVKGMGGEMISVGNVDLTDPECCREMVNLAVNEYGAIDVLVNNAGRVRFAWMENITEEDWRSTIDGELNQVFRMTKAAWSDLVKASGTIVNIASTAGWLAFEAMGAVAHCAAKGGVIALTRQLALEGRQAGVRANSISPGVIETSANREKLRDPTWGGPMLAKIMRGTPGTPEEIANVALFLASDESSYVNAADIVADGGSTAW